jgi:hypothetical protein
VVETVAQMAFLEAREQITQAAVAAVQALLAVGEKEEMEL